MPRRTLFTLLVALLLSLPLSAQTWHQGHLGSLEITTDSGDAAARDAMVRIQLERSMVGQVLHKAKITMPSRVRVIMVRDIASVTRAVPSFPADAVGRGALEFDGIERSSLIFVAPAQWESASRALASILLSGNYPHTPRWFDVGFARYMGTMQSIKEQVELGRAPSDDHPGDAWIPAPQMMVGGSENDPQWQHEAWLMVHWLITNDRLDQAGKYFYLTMNQQVPPKDAIFQAFQEDAATLDRDLRAYDAEVSRHVQRVAAPDLQQSVTFDVNKVPPLDAQVSIASTMLDDHDRSESPSAAMKLLSGIMHNSPDSASVQRALAYGYFSQRDSISAVDHARRAITLQDSDAMMHYILAVGMNGGDPDTIRTNMADIKLGTELGAALRMEPDFPPAFELRGLALLSDDKQAAGLKDLGHAAALRPRNDAYLFHLGDAQAASGDWDNARILFAVASHSSDPEIAQAAAEQLKTGKRLKKEQKHWNEQGIASSTYQDMTDPRWKPTPEMEAREKQDGDTKPVAGPDTRKVMHLEGELASVDCSGDPGAILTVRSRGNTWKLKVADRKSVVLIGPDHFSCTWSQKTVSINFKSSGGVTGDVVSLEID